jgi:hypothetical protein
MMKDTKLGNEIRIIVTINLTLLQESIKFMILH